MDKDNLNEVANDVLCGNQKTELISGHQESRDLKYDLVLGECS